MDQFNPLITVIVIFRNAGATLRETLSSLQNAPTAQVEYLLVDDHSTDGGPILASDFIRHNPHNSRLIALPPGSTGTAAATHAAFLAARGKYVMRCDADDCLPSYALTHLADIARNTDADVIAGPITYQYREYGHPLREKTVPVRSLDLNDMPIDTAHFSLANKLIRRELITTHNLYPIPGIDRWEDLGIVARALALAGTTAITDKPIYHYIRRTGQNTLSATDPQAVLRDHIAMARALQQWFSQHHLADKFEPFLLRLKFIAKVKLLRHRPRRLRLWQSTFPEVNPRILTLTGIPLRYRLLFALASHL